MSRAKNRSEARRQLRRRLEALGVAPQAIEPIVWDHERRVEARHESNRHRAEVAAEVAMRRERLADQEASLEVPLDGAWEPPDDKGYRPARIDPVLTGTARAAGQTAAAVKRRRTLTRAQYEQREAGS